MKTSIKRLSLLPLLMLGAALLLGSCDSGDITDGDVQVSSKGQNVKLTANLHGMGQLPSGYSLALAGFQDGNKYAVRQRAISSTTGDGDIQIVLPNVGGNVQSVELVVTNVLRERVLTLASIRMDDYEGQTDTIRMDMGDMDMDMTGCLQQGVLDKACIQCHGANGRKAAGLDLTRGNTYADLVNVPSTTQPGQLRVMGGSPEGSLLWHILNDGGENILHYNHTEVISSQFKDNLTEVRDYLRRWIEQLPTAQE